MNKKIALVMSTVLLISSLQTNYIFAVENTSTNTSSDKTAVSSATETAKAMNLSIDEAVKLAKENSREMWKIDDKLKELQQNKKDANKAKDAAEESISAPLSESSITDNYLQTLMYKNGYSIKSAENMIKQYEYNKKVLDINIEIQTKSLYYQVLVAEKTIEINESNLVKAKEQLRVINLKFSKGTATKAEVLNCESAVQKAQTEIDTSKDDLEMAKLNLINFLNISFDTQLTLTDKELSYVPANNASLSSTIEKAKKERPEILTAENNLELQKIETHVYTAYYTSNLREHKAAINRLEDAELAVPQAYKDVELSVRKTYLNLVKDERSIKNMDETIKLAQESARVNKLLYENGMATSLDVLAADTDLAQAEISRYQLLVSYNINKMAYDNSHLIGNSSSESAGN